MTPRPHPHHLPGFGAVELILAMAVSGAALAALVVVSNAVRNDAARQQTRQTLRLLQGALEVYQQNTRNWPRPPASVALADLLSDPVAAAALQQVPLQQGPYRQLAVLDGFGRPLHYLPPGPGRATRPDFVSAGADGILGDPDSPDPQLRLAISDNLFGREVRPAVLTSDPDPGPARRGRSPADPGDPANPTDSPATAPLFTFPAAEKMP